MYHSLHGPGRPADPPWDCAARPAATSAFGTAPGDNILNHAVVNLAAALKWASSSSFSFHSSLHPCTHVAAFAAARQALTAYPGTYPSILLLEDLRVDRSANTSCCRIRIWESDPTNKLRMCGFTPTTCAPSYGPCAGLCYAPGCSWPLSGPGCRPY
ncbi:hypothetical protein EVAR_38971_1 [Eumeta japonica]|uniref:Uncharacterized protein n=1 Tax=Eumeta variegata TaxID=151549 RepID=A0A4C1WA25_EUMVA|nr:hypothetical protein EVAR_38971_1 [Eumeta japonica]